MFIYTHIHSFLLKFFFIQMQRERYAHTVSITLPNLFVLLEVPHIQSVVRGLAALPLRALEMQNLGPSIDLLRQNLHFSKSSG